MLPVDLHTALVASPSPLRSSVAVCVSVIAAVRYLQTHDSLASVAGNLSQLASLLYTKQPLLPPVEQTKSLARTHYKLMADEFGLPATPPTLTPAMLRQLWLHFVDVFENVPDGILRAAKGDESLCWVLSHSKKVRKRWRQCSCRSLTTCSKLTSPCRTSPRLSKT